MLDIRSGLLIEIVNWRVEFLDEGFDWDDSPTDRVYHSYQVVFFDDQTDPSNGNWRAPEDLKPLNAMEVIAHAAVLHGKGGQHGDFTAEGRSGNAKRDTSD